MHRRGIACQNLRGNSFVPLQVHYGPLGIEDATRTDSTRDPVVDTDYPTHGGLRFAMSRAFKLAGCNSWWDDFMNDDGVGDERVDQLPGLYMDDMKKVAEYLSLSMLNARKLRHETHFSQDHLRSRVRK